jgi:hypothetical protein
MAEVGFLCSSEDTLFFGLRGANKPNINQSNPNNLATMLGKNETNLLGKDLSADK